jgi:hypothetical protein
VASRGGHRGLSSERAPGKACLASGFIQLSQLIVGEEELHQP